VKLSESIFGPRGETKVRREFGEESWL